MGGLVRTTGVQNKACGLQDSYQSCHCSRMSDQQITQSLGPKLPLTVLIRDTVKFLRWQADRWTMLIAVGMAIARGLLLGRARLSATAKSPGSQMGAASNYTLGMSPDSRGRAGALIADLRQLCQPHTCRQEEEQNRVGGNKATLECLEPPFSSLPSPSSMAKVTAPPSSDADLLSTLLMT
ncbi:unnamed protein product [Gadus morhua 'NCC']